MEKIKQILTDVFKELDIPNQLRKKKKGISFASPIGTMHYNEETKVFIYNNFYDVKQDLDELKVLKTVNDYNNASFLTKLILNPEDSNELVMESNNCMVTEENFKEVLDAVLSELSDDELFGYIAEISNLE